MLPELSSIPMDLAGKNKGVLSRDWLQSEQDDCRLPRFGASNSMRCCCMATNLVPPQCGTLRDRFGNAVTLL